MKYEYKTVTFTCTFSTAGKMNAKLQQVLDEYSKQGWKLHSVQIPLGEFCTCIFEREKNEPEAVSSGS